MKYLRLFDTFEDYSGATLDYPNVSLIEDDMTVIFKATEDVPDTGDTPTPISDYVDLGLPSGLLWATCNIGAQNPTDNGLYFSWGNADGHAKNSGYDFNQSNYNSSSGSSVGSNISPNSNNDAAYVNLGEGWRMPTNTEFQELVDNTDVEHTSIDGVNGCKFMNKLDHNTYIFIPLTGHFEGTTLTAENSFGYYWSSKTFLGYAVYFMSIDTAAIGPQLFGAMEKYFGLTIRAVKEA